MRHLIVSVVLLMLTATHAGAVSSTIITPPTPTKTKANAAGAAASAKPATKKIEAEAPAADAPAAATTSGNVESTVEAPAPATTSGTSENNVETPAPAITSHGQSKPSTASSTNQASKAPKTDNSKAGEPYPRDVRVRYLESCTGLNKNMIEPCKCMLGSFQKLMSFDDFVKLSNRKSPEMDPRFKQVADHCIKNIQQ